MGGERAEEMERINNVGRKEPFQRQIKMLIKFQLIHTIQIWCKNAIESLELKSRAKQTQLAGAGYSLAK